VTPRSVAAAELPPPGLVGLHPAWSRLVTAVDHRGDQRTWHVIDSAAGADDPGGIELTVLAVHGNPTWSYLWRDLVARAPERVRVVAVDQLDMGFSERTGVRRRLADRVEDLGGLTEALGLDGPVVTVAHDWGGPVSLGWALAHRDQLAGVVLTNTAVHQPEGSPAPGLIRTARLPGVLRRVTVDTTTFIRGALAMSRPRPASEVADGYLAPYGSRDRREAIAGFVEDIPLDASHPSAAALDAIADGLDALASVPVLLAWGPEDKVFSDLYLHDLEERLPHADVHRFVGAAHMVPEDADVAGAVWAWVDGLDDRAAAAPQVLERQRRPPLWAALDRGDDGDRPAVVELADGQATTITFAELHRRVEHLAAGLVEAGVEPGDRVALLVPPGIDLTVVLYACWRMGAVMVLVDSGLGPRNMSRALASAAPDHLIAITKGLLAAQALRWPGRRIAVDDLAPAAGVCSMWSPRSRSSRSSAEAPPPQRRPATTTSPPSCSRRVRPARPRASPTDIISSRPNATSSPSSIASAPTTASSPPSRRSRCSGPRSASPRRCPTWTSPARAR
jgi:olefin beta-lactone synthetase